MDDLAAAATSTGLGWGVAITAFFFGVRHGFDLDHLAAITDITGAQRGGRRSLVLSTIYALGHALVLLALGTLAIVAGAYIPEAVDSFMGRVIGVTLIVLGVYVLYSVARYGARFRMQGRWTLLLSAARHAIRTTRSRPIVIVIEHEHDHDHSGSHVHEHADPETEIVTVGATRSTALFTRTRVGRHRHAHRHIAAMPDDPFTGYSKRAALGIGMIHGVGAETPTQILLFATAAGVGSKVLGLILLGVFVAGLFVANTIVALASSLGFLSRSRHPRIYTGLALATGAFSLFLGAGYLLG